MEAKNHDDMARTESMVEKPVCDICVLLGGAGQSIDWFVLGLGVWENGKWAAASNVMDERDSRIQVMALFFSLFLLVFLVPTWSEPERCSSQRFAPC